MLRGGRAPSQTPAGQNGRVVKRPTAADAETRPGVINSTGRVPVSAAVDSDTELRTILEVHVGLDRGVDAEVHLGLLGDERAPGRAAARQVLRQLHRVRVVASGQKLLL